MSVRSVGQVDAGFERTIRDLAAAGVPNEGRRRHTRLPIASRNGLNRLYVQALSDADAPGTVGDLVTLATQHDVLVGTERAAAFRDLTPEAVRGNRAVDEATSAAPASSGYYRILEEVRAQVVRGQTGG